MNYIQEIKKITLFFFYFLNFSASAEIIIKNENKSHSWKSEWSQSILLELAKDEYRIGESALLNLKISEEDLLDLSCTGYNKASLDDKSNFWLVFFSALARSESNFNVKARSKMSRGHRSLGLLQLATSTAKSNCQIIPPKESVLDPILNLNCGIKLISWQLNGAPTKSGKKLRSDLEGEIFGKYMFQWGPLRQNDFKGKKLLTDWFKAHLAQLDFCI
jgi:hypothetical protein